jgi:hypothetical protein
MSHGILQTDDLDLHTDLESMLTKISVIPIETVEVFMLRSYSVQNV